MSPAPILEGCGLDVIDLREDNVFARRKLHARDAALQLEGLRRLSHAFVEQPDTVLDELVNAAVKLCGADSAGISVVRKNPTDDAYWEWLATAGEYSPFLHAILPRTPSACGMTLERGAPQIFRVHKRFFDILGVEAPLVTDGLLLPWQEEETRGTIFIMAHGRDEAFDLQDCHMMQTLAEFAAMAVRQQRLRSALLAQATAAAASAMANDLAHEINNPLQSLTNLVYLALQGESASGSPAVAAQLTPHLERLSALVEKLLALPGMVRS